MRGPIQILHVDDDPNFGDLTATFLEREDDRFAVQTVTSAADGLDSVRNQTPDCVVSDYDMPRQDGIEFLRAVREEFPELPFILFTGKGSEEVAGDAISAGVTDYLRKGSGSDRYELLANRIENAVATYRSQQLAEQRKQRLELFFEASPIGTVLWDEEFRFEQINERAEEILGYDESELKGESWDVIVADDDRDYVGDVVEQLLSASGGEHAVNRNVRADGTVRTCEWHNRAVTHTSNDGEVQAIFSMFRDITEREARKTELEQIETLFQHAQDSLFLIEVGDEFRIERVNPAWEDATGVSAETVRGRTPREVLGDEQGREVERRYQKCIERREPIEYEEQLQFGDEQTWWETQIAPVVIEGEVEYIAGSTRDVTQIQERQRELRILQEAIDDANIAITLADPSEEDNPLVYVNDAYEELTGYSAEESLGRNCRYLQGENTDPERVAAVREAIDEEEPITVELRNYRKDGTEFWNRLTITPLYDSDKDLVRYLGSQQDVTERKERERELRAEREFTRQALDTLDDLFYVLDADGTIQQCNEQAVETTGYERAELEGLSAIELFPEDERQTVVEAVESTLANGEATIEADLLTSDGQRYPYEFKGARLTDVEGNTTGLVGIGRDLTPRKQREQRFRALVEKSNDIISVLDDDGQFRYQSPSIEGILGYDAEGPVSDTVWEYVHPEDRDAARDWFERVTAGEATEPLEFRARHADGSWRWMEAQGNDQLDNPAVEGYVINSRDITARKEREQELEELTSQYEALIENFPRGGVFLFDEDVRYVRAGGEDLDEVDLTSADFEQATPQDLFPDDIADEHIQYFKRTLAGERHTYQQEYQGLFYEIRTMPIRDDAGEVIYGMVVSRNITQQVKQRRELERQNERLEEFASVVSHDLRNPLRVATGKLELAQEACDSQHLEGAADAIDRSQALIEDLLTLARSDDTIGSPEVVSVSTLVEECWGVIPAEGAGLTVEAEQTVSADRKRLRQLLENLLGNAVKHGGESVTVRVGDLPDGFYVADDGPGIPEDEREDIFEAGYSTAEDGTGFGLRIIKQIVEAHDWTIRVTDSDDGGARVEVTGVETVE